MIKIRIPATSANLGAGFDSLGLAVNLYNYVYLEESEKTLITSKSNPVFGGVYKLCAIEQDGELVPRIKLSETIEKVNLPHFKRLCRFFSKDTGRNVADLVTLRDETIHVEHGITIFDPVASWKKKFLTNVEKMCIRDRR